jgi:hypothetical protein
VRGEAVLLALGRDERQREPRTDDEQLGPLAQQERDGADVVFMAVGEHERIDVVEPVLDRPEVRENQVDPWRVLRGEQHPTIDDEQAPVVLEDRHVAADLTDAAERDHAQAALGQPRWRCGRELGAVHRLRRGGTGPRLLATAGTTIGSGQDDPSAR